MLCFAAGYEVSARVGETVIPESYYFWHTTGTVGTIGAGAAAACILGLDAMQTVHALGSAGTQASGLWEFVREGAMSKPLHAGKAAYSGVLAAYLARAGFTGATRILEGEKGFCRAMTTDPHWNKLTEGLGTQYCTACAMRYGAVGIEQFAPAVMHDAVVRKLMQRIEVRQDAAVQAVYDEDATKLAAKVAVKLRDGRLLEREVDYPKGDPANPMEWKDSTAKFMNLVKPVYGIEKASKLVDIVDTLDDVGDFALNIQTILE